MSIHTRPGERVIFSFPENGMDGDHETNQRIRLSVGDVLTVSELNAGQSMSSFYSLEFPGVPLNTVNFSNEKPHPEDLADLVYSE